MKRSASPVPTIVAKDPYLLPFASAVRRRMDAARELARRLTKTEASLADFASGHTYFGLHRTSNGWVLRERAPNATRIVLVGDFTGWTESEAFSMRALPHGVWELELPATALQHGHYYKLIMYWNEGGGEIRAERIPSFARRVVQDPASHVFSAQVWDPPKPYKWRAPDFRVSKDPPLIYEAHVGMAHEEERVGSYVEFAEKVLPRIAEGGYNTIQLMAIQEHPYYGSFGYQVSNFFAPSSRFGTPEELMALIDRAHELGLAVIMDLVHSHAVKNEIEGLSRFDGSYTLYFHEGERGEHPAWNTRLFDYGKPETLHYLLSNCRYWLDTFRFDGYRFDGVTSMIYRDHGLGAAFASYDDYFNPNVDDDALVYLALANEVVHAVRSDALTIAEEVSGMPGLAARAEEGGVGFDYRLAMGVPDYWIKVIKHKSDETWDVAEMWWELSNRRADERTIGYAESHDQALVGDKTIIFRLADKEMYWFMRTTDQSLVIDRAIALHKMIRLFTLATAGNGYLNFMGNEFGHPEWIDFPREGNGWSYKYARRQWSLRDDPLLRYHQLGDFDRAMVRFAAATKLHLAEWPYKHYEHIEDQVIAFERAGHLFVFNFSPSRSYEGREISAPEGAYTVVLDSDEASFGGFDRIDHTLTYRTQSGALRLYLPARVGVVLRRK